MSGSAKKKLAIFAALMLVYLCGEVVAITNNADLIWYESELSEKGQNYFARQPIPEGLIRAYKIVVNQKLPVLWEVKFSFFNNLEALMIDDCDVNEITRNAFKDLKPLTTLSLSMNNVREVQEGVFNHVQIKHLNFSHNKISIIAPAAFDNMPLLETLILDFNELKQWNSDWFSNLTRIRTVSCTHNFLEELPDNSFKNFQEHRLVNFYFSYNKIQQLHSKTLEDSGTFGDFFLDWNDLERVSGVTFTNFTSIEHLNLTGNSIECLSDQFLRNTLNTTKILSLTENPLGCECLAEIQEHRKKSLAQIELAQKQLRNC